MAISLGESTMSERDEHSELELKEEAITPLGGGRNSRVYSVLRAEGKKYLLKKYFRNAKDSRDRLQVEFDSLQFLWGQGVRVIPQPIAMNKEKGEGVYSFINGRAVKASEINIHDIDAATNFLAQLRQFREKELSGRAASDACFSLRSMERILERRLSRLLAVSEQEGNKIGKPGLFLFLKERFLPARDKIISWAQQYAAQQGIGWNAELPSSQRTLSPSDFGFHNAVRQRDGNLVFYDFEYFGWDDPAKLIVDFLHHPGMQLTEQCKKRYVQNMLDIFSDDQELLQRITLAYPLLGLVWCLILLNEFVDEEMQRRTFSRPEFDAGALQEEQLFKAEQLLFKIGREYSCFPYTEISPKVKLDARSRELRRVIIQVAKNGKRGHIPSAISLVEIFRVLFDEVLQYDPQNPRWEGRDRLILSKGHACIVLYVFLAEKGFFPKEELWKFCKIDGILGGHPEHIVPGVEWSTGSLGHGLSVGVGKALSGKREKAVYRVFVILGDGESNEGSIWEAAMCASKHDLDNLVAIVDYNKQVTYGTTYEVQDVEPFADKWRSFGFAVREVDGHDINELRQAFEHLPFEPGKPNLILCHTIKGKGIKMLERNFPWHHKSNLSESEIQQLLQGLEAYEGTCAK